MKKLSWRLIHQTKTRLKSCFYKRSHDTICWSMWFTAPWSTWRKVSMASCWSQKTLKSFMITCSWTVCPKSGVSATTVWRIYIPGCMTSNVAWNNWITGLSKASLMSSGFPASVSPLDSLLRCNNKLLVNWMFPLINFLGNSCFWRKTKRIRCLLKTGLTSTDCS